MDRKPIRTEADGRRFVGNERVWDENEWRKECNFLTAEMDKPAAQRMGSFLSYCKMQRDAAVRHHRDDSAQYIQHIIDDLEA